MRLRVYIILIGILSGMLCHAQPGNPSYSLSAKTFFEIDMQSIALLDIESSQASANFTLSVPIPTNAGSVYSNPLAVNSHNWLNYSSAVRNVISRNIQAHIGYGSLPASLSLHLSVSPASGSGMGGLGMAGSAALILTNTPQNIITSITGAFTGDGALNGHQLNFELHYNGTNFEDLSFGSENLTIIYTIIDN